MIDIDSLVKDYVGRVKEFKSATVQILGVHEESPSRIVILDTTYQTLQNLTLQQDELLRQSLRCIESELYRASHVMAWAGFMDFLEGKLVEDNFVSLKSQYPKWNANSIEELRDFVADYQLIEAARVLGLCTRGQMKRIHGLLSRRNECAHPSAYSPGLNESLGYVSEILQFIKQIQPKSV